MRGGPDQPNMVLRALMDEYGFTVEGLARALDAEMQRQPGASEHHTDPRHVRRWLSGETLWPWTKYHEPLTWVFGRSMIELGFIPRSARGAAGVTLSAVAAPSRTSETEEEDPVFRRDFVVTLAGSLALPRSGRIGMTDVARVRHALDELHGVDDQYGASGLADIAELYVARLQDAMSRCVYGPHVEKALYATIGDLAASAGWFAFDANEQMRARRSYETGITAARLAGDSTLEARLWSYLSRQAYEMGNGAETVAMARTGLSATRRNRDPLLTSLLSCRIAIGYARQGETGQAARALNTAESAYDHAQGQSPAWLAFFGPDEILAQSAMCQYSLGQFQQADRLEKQSIDLLTGQFQRNRFASVMNRANYRLAYRDVEQSVSLATEALIFLPSMRSTRLVIEMSRYRDRLSPYTGIGEVDAFIARHDRLSA
jgi:tetratricopeptide (TPR) repeat protein